ncbi:hypothetical protein V6Z11_A02G164900 [Gossypium hirsutum]
MFWESNGSFNMLQIRKSLLREFHKVVMTPTIAFLSRTCIISSSQSMHRLYFFEIVFSSHPSIERTVMYKGLILNPILGTPLLKATSNQSNLNIHWENPMPYTPSKHPNLRSSIKFIKCLPKKPIRATPHLLQQ